MKNQRCWFVIRYTYSAISLIFVYTFYKTLHDATRTVNNNCLFHFALCMQLLSSFCIIWPRSWNFDPNKNCLTVFVDDFVSTNRAECVFFPFRRKKIRVQQKHSYGSVWFCLLWFLFQRSVKRTQSRFGIKLKLCCYEWQAANTCKSLCTYIYFVGRACCIVMVLVIILRIRIRALYRRVYFSSHHFFFIARLWLNKTKTFVSFRYENTPLHRYTETQMYKHKHWNFEMKWFEIWSSASIESH